MHYIYGYFALQLCRSNHLVPQSLLNQATTMSIPSSGSTKSPYLTHDSIYKNVTFRHSLFHDKLSSPFCHHYQTCHLIGLSQSCRHSSCRHSTLTLIWSIKYQLLHSSSPSKVCPFHLYSISSRTLEHQSPSPKQR